MTPSNRRLMKGTYMMISKTFAVLLAVGALSTLPSPAPAGCFGMGECWPKCITKFCCDDYCPKPSPRTCKACCFLCDDYCPQRPPCVRGVCRTYCDDYCPKPLPRVNCPSCRRSSCAYVRRGGCTEIGCGESQGLNCIGRAR